jgi:predicted ABC-type ATPase
MGQVRFRMFAGPNGSGKTTFYESLRTNKIIQTEIYISADRIEEILKEKSSYNFNPYHIKISQQDFLAHVKSSGLYLSNKFEDNFAESFTIISGILYIKNIQINSYHASFIATFLVQKLFEINKSFCFETVMSHASKIELLKLAKKLGYKTYFYFLFTNNVDINITRIKERVAYGKHNVSNEKVRNRFYKTFEHIKEATKISDTVFLINNSERLPIIEFQKKNNKVTNNISKNGILNKHI